MYQVTVLTVVLLALPDMQPCDRTDRCRSAQCLPHRSVATGDRIAACTFLSRAERCTSDVQRPFLSGHIDHALAMLRQRAFPVIEIFEPVPHVFLFHRIQKSQIEQHDRYPECR